MNVICPIHGPIYLGVHYANGTTLVHQLRKAAKKRCNNLTRLGRLGVWLWQSRVEKAVTREAHQRVSQRL